MMWDPALPRVMAMMTLSISAHALIAFGAMTTVSETVAPTPLEPVTVAICDGFFAACAAEPFPEIRDWNSLVITLARGECFGACPAYSVTIRGDGNAVVVAGNHTGRPGVHRVRLAKETVRALFEKFRAASFFALKDDYRADITDHPGYAVMLAYDGRRKVVTDYVGRFAGMPLVVTELENAIDEAANSTRWIEAADAGP